MKRFNCIGGWIALIACALLFVAQFIPPLTATWIGPAERMLYPASMGLYSVTLIRGRNARGSQLLAGTAAVLMVAVVILMFAHGLL